MAPDSNKAKDSAASIFDILDSKPKIDSSSDEGTTLQNVNGDIEFRHVSFRYPMRPDVQIFRDLCLNIPSGKVKSKQRLLLVLTGLLRFTCLILVLLFSDRCACWGEWKREINGNKHDREVL